MIINHGHNHDRDNDQDMNITINHDHDHTLTISVTLQKLKESLSQRSPKFKPVTSCQFCTSAIFVNSLSIDRKQSLQELFGPICFVGAFVVYCKYCQNCGTYWESERHSVWGQNSNSIFNIFCFDPDQINNQMRRYQILLRRLGSLCNIHCACWDA